MLYFIIDIWRDIPSNPYKRGFRESFTRLSSGQRFFIRAGFVASVLSLVNLLVGPFVYPKVTNIVICALYGILLLAVAGLLVLEKRNRNAKTHKYRSGKLTFYADFREALSRRGLLSVAQLEECLSATNRELDELKTYRSTTVNSISVVFSILLAFSTLLTSRFIGEANSETEAIRFIILVGFVVLTVFVFVHMIANSLLPALSPKNRLLTCFSKDISSFLMLDMIETSQQSTLKKAITMSQNDGDS